MVEIDDILHQPNHMTEKKVQVILIMVMSEIVNMLVLLILIGMSEQMVDGSEQREFVLMIQYVDQLNEIWLILDDYLKMKIIYVL